MVWGGLMEDPWLINVSCKRDLEVTEGVWNPFYGMCLIEGGSPVVLFRVRFKDESLHVIHTKADPEIRLDKIFFHSSYLRSHVAPKTSTSSASPNSIPNIEEGNNSRMDQTPSNDREDPNMEESSQKEESPIGSDLVVETIPN
jgi:hypothetical protein